MGESWSAALLMFIGPLIVQIPPAAAAPARVAPRVLMKTLPLGDKSVAVPG